MANYRQIHVSILKDEWFLDLLPEEKLLFIYLFSNESTSLAGIYKIAFRVICFETGLSEAFVNETLKKFAEYKKVIYEDGIVWVKNMRRHHETSSDRVQTRIKNDIASIPDCGVKIAYLQYEYSLSIPYGYSTVKEEEEEEIKRRGEEGNSATPEIFDSFSISRIICDASGMAAIPPAEYQRIEKVASMIDIYGEETVSQKLKTECDRWKNTRSNKSGTFYRVTNMGWVDWAQDALVGNGRLDNPPKFKTIEEELKWREEQVRIHQLQSKE